MPKRVSLPSSLVQKLKSPPGTSWRSVVSTLLFTADHGAAKMPRAGLLVLRRLIGRLNYFVRSPHTSKIAQLLWVLISLEVASPDESDGLHFSFEGCMQQSVCGNVYFGDTWKGFLYDLRSVTEFAGIFGIMLPSAFCSVKWDLIY